MCRPTAPVAPHPRRSSGRATCLLGYDRYRQEPHILEGGDRFQRGNDHVPYLQLIGQLRVNKLCLLAVVGVSSIADGRVYLIFVHYLWRGDRYSMLSCMSEEWGIRIRSYCERLQFWGTAHFCACLKKPLLSPALLVCWSPYIALGVLG